MKSQQLRMSPWYTDLLLTRWQHLMSKNPVDVWQIHVGWKSVASWQPPDTLFRLNSLYSESKCSLGSLTTTVVCRNALHPCISVHLPPLMSRLLFGLFTDYVFSIVQLVTSETPYWNTVWYQGGRVEVVPFLSHNRGSYQRVWEAWSINGKAQCWREVCAKQ